MGFFGRIGRGIAKVGRGIGDFAKTTAKRVGNFINEGGIGTIGSIASTIGDVLSLPPVQALLTAGSAIPYIGPVARVLKYSAPIISAVGSGLKNTERIRRGVPLDAEYYNPYYD